jgi:thiol-disulfide isomerase/thioredoxin
MGKNNFLHIATAVALGLVVASSVFAQASSDGALPTDTLISWTSDYHAGLETSVTEKKPVLLDFYADWCGPCKMMDAQTYSDPQVIAALGNFVPIKIDIDRDENTAFAYRIRSIPRTLVLNVYGEIVGDIVGFMGAKEFLQFLEDTRKDALTKVDGTQIVVPKDGTSRGAEITSETELPKVFELLTDVEPEVRESAKEELLARKPEDIRETLIGMIKNEYLGSRIAAWEAIAEMTKLSKTAFDPWATIETRNKMLESVLQKFSEI